MILRYQCFDVINFPVNIHLSIIKAIFIDFPVHFVSFGEKVLERLHVYMYVHISIYVCIYLYMYSVCFYVYNA